MIVAECPAIPGCVSQGHTEEEALANIREAIVACDGAGAADLIEFVTVCPSGAVAPEPLVGGDEFVRRERRHERQIAGEDHGAENFRQGVRGARAGAAKQRQALRRGALL